MKIKKQNKRENNVDVGKKKKNKQNVDNKNEVGSIDKFLNKKVAANDTFKPKKVENGNKNKQKLKKDVIKTAIVEEIKKTKKGKITNENKLVKPIVSIKNSKQEEKKPLVSIKNSKQEEKKPLVSIKNSKQEEKKPLVSIKNSKQEKKQQKKTQINSKPNSKKEKKSLVLVDKPKEQEPTLSGKKNKKQMEKQLLLNNNSKESGNVAGSNKKSKKNKEEIATGSLNPDMTSSELLLSLNKTKPTKKNKQNLQQAIEPKNKENIKSKAKKVNNKDKKEDTSSPKSNKLAENGVAKKSKQESKKKIGLKIYDQNKKKFGKKDKVKKTEKPKNKKKFSKDKPIPSLREAPEFDEENFNAIVNLDNVKKTVKTFTKIVKKEADEKKNIIFKDYRYILDLGLFKIPSAPKRVVKLRTKHSIVGDDDDVVLIVKDLKRGMRIDYEPTVHYYEDLIREKGIEGIKTVMPFNQLKKEYQSYEMKRKLANLYDYFICDSAISGHVFAFLGKAFYSKQRCALYSVRTDNPHNLKSEISKSLKKTCFKQGSKGDSASIIVGNHKNTPQQVADNIIEVVEQLKTALPGGQPNIRSLSIKINLKGTSSLPLYLSMGKPPKDTPYIIGTKEQKLNKLKEKAEQILEKFTFTNDGSIEAISPEEIESRKRKRDESSDKKENSKKSKKAKLEEKVNEEPKENKKAKKAKTNEEVLEKTKENKNAKKAKLVEKVKEEPKAAKKKENKNIKSLEPESESESDDSDDENQDLEETFEGNVASFNGVTGDDSDEDDSEEDESDDDESEEDSD